MEFTCDQPEFAVIKIIIITITSTLHSQIISEPQPWCLKLIGHSCGLSKRIVGIIEGIQTKQYW